MPWEMLNKQREGRERKPHSRVTRESHGEGGRAGGTRASFAPRCLRIKRLERHPKPWVTHSTAEETAPGGRVTGSESHGLCAREEPSRSWAAWPQETLWSFLVSGLLSIQPSVRIWPPKPFSPSSTCFLLFFKATPFVALSSLPSLSPQPDTRPRICPRLAPFGRHLCKEVFFDHPIADANIRATGSGYFFVLELITIRLYFAF